MRIAIAGFQHETNTFARTATTWQDFVQDDTWPGLCEGDAVLAALGDADDTAPRNIPVSGFIAAARRAGDTLVPIAWCAAGPGGRVTQDAFERIGELWLRGLREAQFDAVYLDLHGAMAAEHIDDADGELLARVRAAVGPDVPVVASLDLHANVSARMIANADWLVAYRTYPHVDMGSTGGRAHAALHRLMTSTERPVVAWRQIPFLIPLCWQCTDDPPARALYGALDMFDTFDTTDTTDGVSGAWPQGVNLVMGFPSADVPECGPSVWAYAQTAAQAETIVDALAARVCSAEPDFAGELLTADDAVARAQALLAALPEAGPVVIADAQDNPGAGGTSDTTGLLHALIRADVQGAALSAVLGVMVDPVAAALAHAAGEGASVTLRLGAHDSPGADDPPPVDATFHVERLHDGQVQATGSVFRGYQLSLGPSACLRIGGVRVVVASRKVQMLDLALMRFLGVEPTRERILAVKSTVHFRADFAPIAQAVLICRSPGAYELDPGRLRWLRLRDGVRKGN